MKPQLVRGLGLWAAISLNVANTIGTGVFLKARVMTCNVGDPITVMAVWLAAGLLVLAGALTYSELTAMMPEAGGEYVILRETYGPRWGFLYGWTYTGVSRAASLAAQAFSGAIFLNIVTGGKLEGKIAKDPTFGLPATWPNPIIGFTIAKTADEPASNAQIY